MTELMLPRDIRRVDALPVLGTGKLDYVTMGQMATTASPSPAASELAEVEVAPS